MPYARGVEPYGCHLLLLLYTHVFVRHGVVRAAQEAGLRIPMPVASAQNLSQLSSCAIVKHSGRVSSPYRMMYGGAARQGITANPPEMDAWATSLRPLPPPTSPTSPTSLR
jgi:hypothetical protein